MYHVDICEEFTISSLSQTQSGEKGVILLSESDYRHNLKPVHSFKHRLIWSEAESIYM